MAGEHDEGRRIIISTHSGFQPILKALLRCLAIYYIIETKEKVNKDG